MKSRFSFAVVFGSLLVSSVLIAQAQTGAPAGATGKCKDGTFTTAATKQGACRGHKGIDTWFATAAPAQKPAPARSSASTAAPASGAMPAGATGKCKDGTFTTAATKQGACRGHKGIDTWFAAAAAPAAAPAPPPRQAATPAPAASPAAAPAYTPPPARAAEKPSAPNAAAAPGGGPGLVWVNTASNVYHCYGTHWYGTTKAGKYMTEADAKAAGARPNRGNSCSK